MKSRCNASFVILLLLTLFGTIVIIKIVNALTINNGEQVTNSRSVTLNFDVPQNCVGVGAKNENESNYTSIGCASPQQWTLSDGDGQKTVTLQKVSTYQYVCDSYCCGYDTWGNCTTWCYIYCTGYNYTYDSGSIVLNTHPPDTTIYDTPSKYSSSYVSLFSFNSNEPVKRFDCLLYSDTMELYDYNCGCCSYDSWGNCDKSCTNPPKYFWRYNGLPDGNYTFSVIAVDLADYLDITPATYTWTIDTQPPTDGSLTVNVINKDIYLWWSGFSDATSGIDHYG
jgi:hypothetical protein